MDTGYLQPDLRNSLGGRTSLISASPCMSACFPLSVYQILYLWSTRLKNGYHFRGDRLWLGGEAPQNKHGCQEPATEAVHVGEVGSQKGGTRDSTVYFSTVPLL